VSSELNTYYCLVPWLLYAPDFKKEAELSCANTWGTGSHSSKGVALSEGTEVRVLKEKSLTTYAPRRFSAFGVEWSANMPVVSWAASAWEDRRREETDGTRGRGGESNRSPMVSSKMDPQPQAHERPPLFFKKEFAI
jgi:hypothetical protein